MLIHYEELSEHLGSLQSEELNDLRLTRAESRRLNSLLVQLRDLDSITKKLRDDTTSMADNRLMFDAVM